jgi:phosphopantetheinyl transferase
VPLDAADVSAATRLWCAKEAMAKARGTGLQGRPKDFAAQEIEENGTFLLCHREDGEQWVVHTASVGPFVLAYTSAQDRIDDFGLRIDDCQTDFQSSILNQKSSIKNAG